MSRRLSFPLAVLLTVFAGLCFGGCLWGSCPDLDPIPLHDGVFLEERAVGPAPAMEGLTVDDALEVAVDTAAAEVTVRFTSEGRSVELRYAITGTSTF